MEELKTGDVVKLKSGGPEMTIEKIARWFESPVDQAKCTWFNGDKIESKNFELTSLVKTK